MTSGNAYPNQPEPDTSRERIELETRVLAAALRQSLERGDTAGSSHAHQQIFILLKASQEMGWEEPITLPPELLLEVEPKRPMPDIDWGAPAEGPIISGQAETLPEVDAAQEIKAEVPTLASDAEEAQSAIETPSVPAAPVELELASPGSEPVVVVANSAAVVLPLAKVPTFALVPVPSFTVSAPATGAAAILDFYLRLQVSDMADFSSIHKSFLRKVRPLLRQHAAGTLAGQARKDLLLSLQSLWIAHDILCDPVTRTDYDFRRMGLRGGSEEVTEGKPSMANRPQLRIGELLLCAGLLETTELEIAADMHKAMPELMFGAFLVKQGFIEEDDLSCVLVGQQLLKTGGITAAQFQEAMVERAKSGKELGDILVARRYLTPVQLQEAYRNQMDDTFPRLPVVVSTVSLQDSAADVAQALSASDDETVSENENESVSENDFVGEDAQVAANQSRKAESEELSTAPRPRELLNSSPSLNIGNAVPSWKDQLDWDSPAESENISPSLVDTSPDLDALPQPSQGVGSPSLASLYDTATSRSDTSELPPAPPSSSSSSNSSYSAFARPEPGKKKSLTDLMAELEPSYSRSEDEMPEQSPFASIWADNSSSSRHDDDLPPAAVSSISPGAQDDFAPPSLEHDEDLSQVEEEFAALDAAADEALHISEQEEVPSAKMEAPSGAALDANLGANLGASLDANREASVTATSELNAVPNSSEPLPPEKQKGSGSSWQIVSVPASALASLLLDDEPEAKGKPTATGPGAAGGKERRQLKTSFANDKPFTTKSNLEDDNLPPGGDRRSRRRKSK